MTKLSYTQLSQQIAANLADNTQGDISASDVRNVDQDSVDSMWNTWKALQSYQKNDVVWHPTTRDLIYRLADGTSGTNFIAGDWGQYPFGLFTYDYDKRSNLTIPETYTEIGNVTTPVARRPGVYYVAFSVAYVFADVNDSAYFQFRINGSAFYEFILEPSDQTDRLSFIYNFPFVLDTEQVCVVELQSRKSDVAASTLSIEFADTVFQRVN